MGSSTNKMLKPYHFDHLKGPNNSLIWFFSKRHRFWKLILILFIFIVCFLLHQRYSFYKIKPLLTINKYEDLQFHESKNETGKIWIIQWLQYNLILHCHRFRWVYCAWYCPLCPTRESISRIYHIDIDSFSIKTP